MSLVDFGRARPVLGTGRSGRVRAVILLVAGLGLAPLAGSTPAQAAGDPCGPPVVSVIACENSLPGDPPNVWRLSGGGDTSIQGFATAMSVNAGDTESFKVKTSANSYHLDIFRLGYYQGNGARKIVGGLRPTASLPQSQPACLTQASTGLVDCGNWGMSASWTVPATAVSGIYLANLVRDDTGGTNQVVFVVRNDASHSDLLVQTSDTTWQAYNTYGGNSLYTGTGPAGRAYAVSYNRPFSTSSPNFVWDSEYPMVRFLEANGFDVTYAGGLDTDIRGSLLLNHKVFVSSGHDEYWSGGQRASVEAARGAGVNLAFFSGNEVFWKTRWGASIDGSSTANRTLVCYKETHAGQPVDPQDPPVWTGTWRDPRFSPPADGGRPENALTGQFFIVNAGTSDIQVPYAYSRLRLWRNTAVANLAAGQTATLAPGTGTLGYEWDSEPDNGFRPAGLFDLSSTTVSVPEAFTDYGSTVAAGTRTHHLSLYRAASGALVFGSGTVQWSWGLDSDNASGHAPDRSMQQATVNLLADMGVQPYGVVSGLVPAAASTDGTAPTSTITSPAAGTTVADGTRMTASGTATDAGGGGVAGVEVSTDGGATWHPATGTANWSYTWVAHGSPSFTVRSRAVDDSGNSEAPSPGVAVNAPCPCSLWGPNVTPSTVDSGDTGSVEVGMKFTSDVYGTISGIRFYKAGTNTGTHVGNLWTAGGQRLASATFTGETTSGWQQVTFGSPVSISPNTTYVASYFAPKGHYAQSSSYFYPPPSPPPDGGGTVDAGPLHALRNSPSSGNGVYTYGGGSTFPANSFQAENYWVDVVFSPSPPPGQPTDVTATAGYASAAVSWTAPTTGQVTKYTVTPYIGSTAQSPTVVTGDPAPTGTTVTGLTNGTTYTFTVTASNPAGSGPPSTPSNPVTPLASLLIVSNGGFESGLSPWAAAGISPPVVNSTKPHSGSASAVLGTLSGSEPLGDSTLSQTVTIPSGTSTLSFWYWPATTDATCSGAGCIYDWQEAQIRTTSGSTLASALKLNSNSQVWTRVALDTSAYAGQAVVLWFNVHQDGANPADDTSMYLDDVTVTGSLPTAPSAPTGVTASAGNGSATVTWTAPADGGSPITSYTVTPYTGSTAQPSTVVSGAPPATSTVVGGLANGTTYTFTVTAANAVGAGPASAASNAVTPVAAVVPAFVQQSGAHSGVAGSISVTPPAPITAGNRLVVMVGVWNSNGPTAGAVTDSAGNTYVKLLQFKASDRTEMSVWTAPVTQGGGTRPTVTAVPTAAADLGIQVLEYSGLSPVADATVLDRLKTASGKTGASATTVQSGATAATSAGNELALGFYLDSGFGNTLAGGIGFSVRANTSPAADVEFLAEDQIAAPAATPNASVRTGARTTWLMATVVLRHA